MTLDICSIEPVTLSTGQTESTRVLTTYDTRIPHIAPMLVQPVEKSESSLIAAIISCERCMSSILDR